MPAESIETLIERSSLGTPEAKAIRDSADPETVQRILQRAKELDTADDQLHTSIEVVLLDHADEISGDLIDPNMAELAYVYQQRTGWTVAAAGVSETPEQETADG